MHCQGCWLCAPAAAEGKEDAVDLVSLWIRSPCGSDGAPVFTEDTCLGEVTEELGLW